MKILYDTNTTKLTPYPRSDDEPVVGLDPCYLVLDLIQQEKPQHDSAAHYLRRTEAINLDNLQVTRGWELVAHDPPSIIVTKRSLRFALIEAELFQTIVTTIENIPDEKQKLIAQTWWNDSQTYDRSHPFVATILSLANLTDEQADIVFADAQQRDNPLSV